MTEHRCLAVRQPWAWALVAGLKEYENRSWSTDYRGPVLVLASASKTLVNRFVKADAPSHPLPAPGQLAALLRV